MFQLVELQHVRSVTQSFVGVGVHLEEVACGSEGFGSQCHRRHKPSVASCCSVAGSRTLNAMCAIHNHAWHNFKHVGDVPEIHHQVVVAKAVSALGQPNLFGACILRFFHRVAHVGATQELSLLDVHGLASLGCCNKQVSLPAKESRYLEHIAHRSGSLCLMALVYIGKYAEPIAALHIGEHLEAFLQSWTAERANARSVGFVER